MNAVYIIVENGDPYSIAYTSFECAVAVVKEKFKETIEIQIKEMHGEPICSELDVPENKLIGVTRLYVEKGIHIIIYKLPVLSL
jgi:hypothetical protein